MSEPLKTANRAQCRICGDILHSRTTHEWVACKGRHFYIDGGLEYQRAGTLQAGVSFDDLVYLGDESPNR